MWNYLFVSWSNKQLTTIKGKTWSRGTNSRLPFCANVNLNLSKDSGLRQTANMNLYHLTKFSLDLSFTVFYLYTIISGFTPVLSIRIVLDSFYLPIFYSEKFSTWICRLPFAVCRLPFAVNVTLKSLQSVSHLNWTSMATTERIYFMAETNLFLRIKLFHLRSKSYNKDSWGGPFFVLLSDS